VFWLCVGFAGQAVFTGRFLIQWLASERKGESIVPVAFWYMSLLGGGLLLSYALYKTDPVFILGQLFGVIVYSRNLALIYRKRLENSEMPDSTGSNQFSDLPVRSDNASANRRAAPSARVSATQPLRAAG
jgi:lipid-A-disaccharide synthase-like uncharacterized protein